MFELSSKINKYIVDRDMTILLLQSSCDGGDVRIIYVRFDVPDTFFNRGSGVCHYDFQLIFPE